MNENSRILFISTQMEAGGVQTRSVRMVSALLAEGRDAKLAFLYIKRPVFTGIVGVTSLYDHRPANPLDYFVILFRLYALVRTYRPTTIIGMAHYSSPLAALVGLLCGVPRRIATQTNPPRSHGRVARLLDWLCGTLGIYTSNISVSQTIERCFEPYPHRYRTTLKTIANGSTWTDPGITKAEARDRFGLDRDAFLLINCGRLSPQKNHAFLLDVLQQLPVAKLAVLGEGELRPELEQQITALGLNDRVTLLGEVPSNRVGEFLRCGDMFAFPSRFEGSSLALAEAMLAGLPVVASDHPAVVEMIADAGITLPITDTALWVEAITALHADAAALAGARRRSKARGERFGFNAMLASFKAEML